MYVCGETAGTRNECEVLARIKKGYGWQLEEHPEIAGVVSGVRSGGWGQGPGAAAAAMGREAGAACSAGGWGNSFLYVSHLAGTRGFWLTGIVPERTSCHTELQKLHYPPPHPIVALRSCFLLLSRSRA